MQSEPMSTGGGGVFRPPFSGNFDRPPEVNVSSYQTPIPAVQNPHLQYGGFQPLYGPDAQQLAALHVIPKDLSCFSGDPTE